MNQNETRTLWISVFAALGAVFLLYSYTQEKSDALTKQFGAKQRVVVAKEDIREMATITEDLLEIKEQPVDFVQPQALKSPEDAVGLVALAPLKKGEQVLKSKIMEPGPVTGLAIQVAPTKRAVTIPVDEMRGVAKLLKPGDRIDLVAAIDIGQGTQQTREVKTILQDIPVLATGLKITNELPRLYERVGREEFIKNLRSDTNYSTITVEVSPKEAQDIVYILATSPGSLFMTLRHPSDRAKVRMANATVDSLAGKVSKPVVKRQTYKRKPASRPSKPKPQKKKKKKRRNSPFIDL